MVFRLTKKKIFPPPEMADADGLLAVGGDLTIERLLMAYSMGIFPWYSDDSPILWWSPDPRLLLFPDKFNVSRSLRQTIRKGIYSVTFDTAFEQVIRNCASARRSGEDGTWITEDMIAAYCGLHDAGFAHSVETRQEGELVGGLYGVALGSAFFGESMFALRSNASKVALECLSKRLVERGFLFIDCQVTTAHLLSLGAKEVPRAEFLAMLKKALERPGTPGKWD